MEVFTGEQIVYQLDPTVKNLATRLICEQFGVNRDAFRGLDSEETVPLSGRETSFLQSAAMIG